MKKLLLVKSSVRSGRLADTITELVLDELKAYPEFDVQIADFKELPLPFFDAPHSPSDAAFAPTDPNVITWTRMVGEADAVILLTAEYNYSFTAVLKNAIDWIYKEWTGKPVAFIGYGWVGGERAIKQLHGAFGYVKPALIKPEALLRFQQEIDRATGKPLNDSAAMFITGVLDGVKQAVLEPAAQPA